jgi:anaerobic magnesium-protoporphyrin IX monomethyl ester cyclase
MSLFFTKNSSRKYQPPFSPPLSLLYIASCLEKEGHTVNLIDVTCEEDPEGKIRKLLSSQDAVVLDIYPGNQRESSSFAYFVRDNSPGIPIIIQGLYCTIQPKQVLRDIPLADICIQGEGEYVIKEVAESIDGKRLLSEIPGVHYRENNQIKMGKKPREIKELDTLPFPARHLVKEYDYGMMNGIHLCKPRLTSILTSRSCPFRCRFCATHFIHGAFRQRSPENVIHEFREIQNEYSSVIIEDDNFLADSRRANKIMDGLIQADSRLELFIAGARVDNADRVLYRKMAKAGVKFISYGIESGNQDILDYYHKRITLSQIRNVIDLACEMKIITWGNFIFGAPIETKEHIKNTMKFSLSLPLDMAFYRHLSYQRGSELWEEAVSNGLIEEGTSLCYAGSGKTLTNFTNDELSGYCRQAFKRFYYRPKYLLQEFLRCVKRKDFTILRSLYSAI